MEPIPSKILVKRRGNPNYVTSSDPLELVVDNTRHL